MTLQPQRVEELQDAVRSHDAITLVGAGTKSPLNADLASHEKRSHAPRVVVDLTRLSGITEYTPDECVFTALAGTPLREINARLAAHGQYLPFDPPLVDAGATIGGTVAAGLSGSGRYRYGGVRDFLIGARVVDGNGTVIRSGGRVVKNAAGFLLHHGMVGSLGRFGALTELTFKVFPAPEARATLRVDCGSAQAAFETARNIETRRFDLEAIDFTSTGTMWIRVAGRAAALKARVAQLQKAIGRSDVLEGADDERVWSDAREFAWAAGSASIVKVPTTRPLSSSAPTRYMCAGSLAWIAVDTPDTLSGVAGVIVRGSQAGTRVGIVADNVFEERVRSVLDPSSRFSAASHPSR